MARQGRRPTTGPVFPDGCRDLILRLPPGCSPAWFVSPLAVWAQLVHSPAGQRNTGYRLRPAAVIDQTRLLQAVHQCPDADPSQVLDLLHAHV